MFTFGRFCYFHVIFSQISWRRLNNQLTHKQLSPDGTTLTLPEVTRHHAGLYICEADNGVRRTASQNISLVVHCKYLHQTGQVTSIVVVSRSGNV